MFIALDKKGERISIEEINSNLDYFCPQCGEKLRIKAINSDNIAAHFAHIKKCTDTFSHDMSEWHYNWQLMFPKEYREVIVEKDGIKHRADILINNTVIEFQHSQITSDEIKKRNNFYLSCGLNMVWVFDAEGMIKNESENTLDPKDSKNSLCWKRVQTKFQDEIPSFVNVYLNYNTEISNSYYKGKLMNIMILLEKTDKKYIFYYDTTCKKENRYYYIAPNNFLKEFGCCDNPEVLSISDIIKKCK